MILRPALQIMKCAVLAAGFGTRRAGTPFSGVQTIRGDDKLRAPRAIRALPLGKRLSVAFDTSASDKAARTPAVVDPGNGQCCSRRRKHGMKRLIMRLRVFETDDDHWVTFRK